MLEIYCKNDVKMQTYKKLYIISLYLERWGCFKATFPKRLQILINDTVFISFRRITIITYFKSKYKVT